MLTPLSCGKIYVRLGDISLLSRKLLLNRNDMSKLRDDEAKARKLEEKREIISQVGKEGEEGIKNFKEHAKIVEKAEERKRIKVLDEIETKTKNKLSYNRFLAEILMGQLKGIEWPHNWSYRTAPTEEGVVMELQSPNNFFRSAFRSTGMGEYDLNAIETFALRAEYTLNRRKEKGSIILPNGHT